jgi:hypothetical protein
MGMLHRIIFLAVEHDGEAAVRARRDEVVDEQIEPLVAHVAALDLCGVLHVVEGLPVKLGRRDDHAGDFERGPFGLLKRRRKLQRMASQVPARTSVDGDDFRWIAPVGSRVERAYPCAGEPWRPETIGVRFY